MMTKNNASRLARRVERIKSIEKGTLASVVEIGRELIAAEAECEHGAWANWLKTNFSWSVRTALRYRKVAEFCTACDGGAYGPDVTLGDMDISLSALYFVATTDKAVAKSIALKAIDTRVTLNVAREMAAQHEEEGVDYGEDEQMPAPAAEDDEAAPTLSGDDRREADDGLPPGAGKPLSVALSLLANALDQNPENFIAAAKAFDPERLRGIVSQLERVLKTIAGDESIRQKADRADIRQP
ncbi:DUF3102 domain-containing protein [Bradyrhizobium australiense]|uniref:DUF3102 domain-containing protein n=1 Tax=Bradyrhizobium australiense TaxID=2721161 RepID=A0A7Y4LVT9_9BRAD|nr:DUF3102 domain-containing protein [Bradyrhizobium australiense]NOJ40005.1 DUF3102 domain-containing protein [Bradyrhizobium australiense]